MIQNSGSGAKGIKKKSWIVHFRRHFWLYLFLIPGMLHLFLFRYKPMYGLVIAFTNYSPVKGIWGSEWVGLEHFKVLFNSARFTTVLTNSIVTSVLRLLWGFPMPILLALLLNEMKNQKYKRVMQTVLYLPHFISWVVVISIVTGFLSLSNGIINELIVMAGGEKIAFLAEPGWFRPVLIISEIWKECGWGTVIYMAALAGIDVSLYEAAIVDGANRWQRCWYITVPCILSTVTIMLIMRMGSVLNNGFEQIWLLQNSVNKEVAQVLETYSYELGLQQGRYSFATAIGFFQSVVGCVMVFLSNFLSRKAGGDGLW